MSCDHSVCNHSTAKVLASYLKKKRKIPEPLRSRYLSPLLEFGISFSLLSRHVVSLLHTSASEPVATRSWIYTEFCDCIAFWATEATICEDVCILAHYLQWKSL